MRYVFSFPENSSFMYSCLPHPSRPLHCGQNPTPGGTAHSVSHGRVGTAALVGICCKYVATDLSSFGMVLPLSTSQNLSGNDSAL